MAWVAEQFISINGEGTRAGELAYFVRFCGCNLNCTYCDTKWANRPDTPATKLSAEEIACGIIDSGIKNVTLTGGEPMLQEDIAQLCTLLAKGGCSAEIETNGSVSLENLASISERPVFTMDYKLPSSGMERFMNTDNFALLQKQDTVKFVSGSMEDLERMREITEKYDLTSRCHVYISPVFGMIDAVQIVEYMKDHGMNGVRLQLQLHKYIWDPDKHGV